jgi:hypothetical protein
VGNKAAPNSVSNAVMMVTKGNTGQSFLAGGTVQIRTRFMERTVPSSNQTRAPLILPPPNTGLAWIAASVWIRA